MKRGDSANYSLAQNEAQQVLDACISIEERVIIGCQIFLGLRISEIVHMKADWVTSEGNFHIPSFMACNCSECTAYRENMWKPKTKAGARTLPIASALRKTLFKYLEGHPDGLRLSRVSIWKKTKEVLKRAKIRRKGLAGNTIFPHALRATCFLLLAQGGMDAINLCYYAGWENIAVATHYIQAAKAKDGAIKQARAIFG